MMLIMLLHRPSEGLLCWCVRSVRSSHDAADVAPFLGGVENGGGNDAADAPALCAALEKASP